MSEVDLTSDEVKQAIADAITEATEGLKAKNTELLGKLKKAQQGQAIDPADLQAVEAERDELKSKLADANKALTKATKTAEEATKKAADTDAAFSKAITESALTEALTAEGVTNPVHLKAAKALLTAAGGLTVVDEDGKRVVKAGDKALADFTKEWASGDEGKHFIVNGSGGSDVPGTGGAPPDSKNPFSKGEHFNLTEQARLLRDNPQEAERLRKAAK